MLAIYHYFGFDMPIKERFALIKTAGFDAVGLRRDYSSGSENYREYADLARSTGLQVIDGHAPHVREYPIVNSLWLDNAEGETTQATYLRSVEEASEDGVANLIIHIDEPKDDLPPVNELGVDRLKRLVELAEERGVTIAVENIHKSEYLTYAFDRIQSPRLGFCYDTGHRNWNEPNLDLLSMFGDRLVALHLHDNDGSTDQHLLPFRGNIDWQEQMSRIAATGYAGPTTLECGSTASDAQSPEEHLRDAFAVAKRLDAMRVSGSVTPDRR